MPRVPGGRLRRRSRTVAARAWSAAAGPRAWRTPGRSTEQRPGHQYRRACRSPPHQPPAQGEHHRAPAIQSSTPTAPASWPPRVARRAPRCRSRAGGPAAGHVRGPQRRRPAPGADGGRFRGTLAQRSPRLRHQRPDEQPNQRSRRDPPANPPNPAASASARTAVQGQRHHRRPRPGVHKLTSTHPAALAVVVRMVQQPAPRRDRRRTVTPWAGGRQDLDRYQQVCMA